MKPLSDILGNAPPPAPPAAAGLAVSRSFAAALVPDLSLPDIRQVLEVFALDLARLTDTLDSTSRAGDHTLFRRAAHGLGGAAGAVGAARLSRVCRHAAERGADGAGLSELAAQIRAEAAPIAAELQLVLAWLEFGADDGELRPDGLPMLRAL